MTPDEYERIKEQEKAHLRALKKLKDRVRELDRKRRISETMAHLTTSAADLLRSNAESLEKLALETLRNEARTEVALEDEALRADAPSGSDVTDASTDSTPGTITEADEEALRKAKAYDLVRQFKMEMGMPDRVRTIGRAEADSSEADSSEADSSEASSSEASSSDASASDPVKTPRRDQPEAGSGGRDQASAPTPRTGSNTPPEKTIGRMRR